MRDFFIPNSLSSVIINSKFFHVFIDSSIYAPMSPAIHQPNHPSFPPSIQPSIISSQHEAYSQSGKTDSIKN